jgi:hypothetical protein
MTISLENKRTRNMGSKSTHWDVIAAGEYVGNLASHGSGWSARWNFLPENRADEYASFRTKKEALEYLEIAFVN